ncbi:Cytosolic 5'-nucleotidase 1A [Channa argus]|uniref:Cytosolic 5'-nucleotidase 1A n=1 Tax=Channa argus TaxID=215402 RepID=A0A6G1QGB6_CHAAH|nr:Cytosolic 5'-nucleotidase 1A [Channa argus]KAK2891634.1 hypothetical protein Q8A73_017299 [Channa argus]
MSNRSSSQQQLSSETEMPITIAMSSELLKQQMRPGPAYFFVKALNTVNAKIKQDYPESKELFKVILINGKSSHELIEEFSDLTIDFLESGEDLIAKLKEHKTHLYLSAEPGFKIQEAVNEGIAAAIIFPQEIQEVTELEKCELRIVFDGDAVLFSDDSERVNKTGLSNFLKYEKENVDNPMTEGPFKGFLKSLTNMQRKLVVKGESIICTYLVTSRNAGYAGYRALNTLKTWGLEIDQAYFLKGSPKGPFLKMIRPHIFFDDQKKHVEDAMKEGILACYVPYCKENP